MGYDDEEDISNDEDIITLFFISEETRTTLMTSQRTG